MNNKGIQFRLLLLGIIPPFILAASLAFYFIQYHYIDLENALKEKGQVTVNQFAISSIYGVFSGNTDLLKDISNALLKEPDIVLVSVMDSTGTDIVLSKQTTLPSKDKLIYFQHPVTINGINANSNVTGDTKIKVIGSVKIALSLVTTHRKQQIYLQNSLFLILFGTILTMLIAIRLSRSISSPIIKLTRSAYNLANGNPETHVMRSTISEIDTLCQSFNIMSISLQKTQQSLITKVDIAVKELNNTLSHLEEKNKSLELTTQLAITQNKTKSQFLAHISHEIRTPMNGILGFIELLTKSDLSASQLDQAQLIKTSATSLLTIVNEILDYSSLETGNFNISISRFNFREIIENSVTILAPSSDNVQIILNIDNNIPTFISTDPIRFQQVIVNLLGNACKFTKKGHIIIRCRLTKNNSLFISISDTGLGIDKKNITKLFQPFLQTSEYAVNNELGTGLGLTISKNIIKRLEGSIGVCSQPHSGSTFWFNIPIVLNKDHFKSFSKLSIFIIDPFTLRRKALTKQLSNLKYRVLDFNSIAELKALTSDNISCDLIFFANKEEFYQPTEIQSHINLLTHATIIFLNPRNTLDSSIQHLSLPCRTSYLEDMIKSLTGTQSVAARVQLTHNPETSKLSSIFIADDNEINRLLLQSQLAPHCKNITLANDGKIAQSYLNNHQYDLILLDLQMPFFSGLDLIKLIRQQGSINQGSPVIAITAHAQSHQRKKLIDAGFDECLIKPVLLEQLQEILGLWLPRVSNTNENTGSLDYVSQMLEKTSGNTALAKTLFIKLFSELLNQSTEIEQALNSDNLITAKEIVHKLHGSVSFCGFTELQSIAKQLEINLSKNNKKQVEINFLQLESSIDKFIKMREQILQKLIESESI